MTYNQILRLIVVGFVLVLIGALVVVPLIRGQTPDPGILIAIGAMGSFVARSIFNDEDDNNDKKSPP